MDLVPARSMITAQEYWSREGMGLVLYGTDLKVLKTFKQWSRKQFHFGGGGEGDC